MKNFALLSLAIVSTLNCIPAWAADPPGPTTPMIPGALPYVPIPGAAAAPDRSHVYKVIFNVTQGAVQPEQPVAGILFAATDLSALRGQGVPQMNTKFALIFHGPGGPALGAVAALLNNRKLPSEIRRRQPQPRDAVRAQAGRGGEFWCAANSSGR